MMVKSAIINNDHLLSFAVELPVPGKETVHLGQRVEVGDVIAESILPARFQVFDVLNQFRLKESELEACMKRLAGEDVQRGDVIAKKAGLISRFFRAPDDGKVVAVRDGRVTLAMGEKIGKAGITSVVIDTETDFIKLGIAKDLAKAMNATYYSLKQLSEEQIIRVVRNVGML